MTVVDENGHNRGRPTKLQKRQRERRQIEDDKPPGHNPYLAPLVKRAGGSGVSWNAGQMRKRAVIAAIGDGKTLKEACKLAGVVEGTYYSWRETDKPFAAAANYARKNGAPQGVQKEAFVSFRKRFFGFDSYYHHLQIIEAIEQAEDMSVTLVLVPPYFGKTTTICDWLNYKIAEDPNVRVAYVSESEGFAKKQLGRIARRMTDTDIAKDYIAEYGPFKDEGRVGKAWSATHFTVAKADHDEADFCADDTTEILTQRGWLTCDELTTEDFALTLNPDTNRSEWSQVEAVNIFAARPREMVLMDGLGHSSLTTPDHRWRVRHWSRDTNEHTWQWRTTDTLSGQCSIPTAAPCDSLPEVPKYSDALVELVAWYWTEGSIGKRSDKNWAAQIGQSHRVNPLYVDRIRRCISEVFGPPVRGKRDGSGWTEYTSEKRGMTIFTLHTDAAREVETLAPDKVATPEFLCSLTAAQLRLFIDTSIDADGWLTTGGPCLGQKRLDRIRSLEMACALAGMPFQTTKTVAPPSALYPGYEAWKIALVHRGNGFTNPLGAKRQRRKNGLRIDRVETSGRVWCPTTATGTWFARRRGTAYFTGNTLETRGINSHVYGARFDIIIFDDIQSMNNLNQTETILEKIRQDFLSRPGRSGKVIFIGTRVNVGDVYERMIDEGIVDKIVQLPATNPVEVLCPKAKEVCDLGHENCCGLHWADGTVVPHEDSMCKELWDNHALARRRRQVGNVTWLRSYQQRPQAAGSATFSEEMIESSKDALRLVGQHSAPVVALGLDPALGGQSALIACALYPDKMEVLDLQTDIGLGRVEQILFRVEQFVALYKPKVLVVETDTLQKGLARDERLRTMSSESGFLVHEHRTAGQKSDETIGVAMMASTFSLGEFRIPWGDAYAQRRMAVLVEELGAWRPQIATRALRQDSVMSAWFVWAYWVRMKQTLLGRENQFSRKGLETVWKRTAAAALSMKRKTA